MNTEIIITCPQCGKQTSIRIWLHDLLKWRNGAYIQDAFRYLTPGEREAMLSGICEPCFDAKFGNEDENES